MANIVILGAGVMGSAFSMPLADNGHRINLVGTHLDGDIIEEVHQSHFHPTLNTQLEPAVSPLSWDRLAEVTADADLVVLGVSSPGVGWAADRLGDVLPSGVPVLMLTKGLAADGHDLNVLPEAFRAGLPAPMGSHVQVMAIGGPSIARELAARRHTSVVLAGPDRDNLERVVRLLRTPYYHVWTSTDIIGVEACVALKNLYSLAVGMVSGLAEREGLAENGAAMHNPAGAVFAQALREIAYLVAYMGGDADSVLTLPGAGDFYVTCLAGRNSRMGRLLGLGMRYSQAKSGHMPDETVEGADLALAIGPTVESMIDNGRLDGKALPLMRTVIDVVLRELPVSIPWDDFFA